MIYGYCRVSSKSQENNNSFEQQEQEILSKYKKYSHHPKYVVN